MSPRPGGDVSNSSEFAVMGSGERRVPPEARQTARSMVRAFIKARPGLALMVAYIVVTLVARFDDVWFYQLFGINLFNYSDPQDVLLAALRHSVVAAFFVVPALIVLVAARLRDTRASGSRPGLFDRSWNTPTLRLIAAVGFVVVSATLLTRIDAQQRSEARKAGRGKYVTLTRNDGIEYGEQPLLIGSTSRFFFLYFPRRKTAEIVPVENTSMMTVDLRPRSEMDTPTASGGSGASQPPLNP